MPSKINQTINNHLNKDVRFNVFLQKLNEITHPGDGLSAWEVKTKVQMRTDDIIAEISACDTSKMCDTLIDKAPRNSALWNVLTTPYQQAKTLRKLISGIYDRFKDSTDNTSRQEDYEIDSNSLYTLKQLYEAGFIAYPDNHLELKGVSKIFIGRSHRIGHVMATELSRILEVPYENIMADAMVSNVIQNDKETRVPDRKVHGQIKIDLAINYLVNGIITQGRNVHMDPGYTSERGYIKSLNRYLAMPESMKKNAIQRMIDVSAAQFPDAAAKLQHYLLGELPVNEPGNSKPKRNRL